MATSYPLSWPAGWPRTKPADRRSARFRRTESVYSAALGRNYTDRREITVSSALDRVVREIERMGVPHQKIIFSTNVELGRNGWPLSNRRDPDDPGVAVYWTDPATKQQQCMAIDIYDSVAGNIAAVAATLDAMRAIERHGGAQILKRAFQGFTALPSTTTALSLEQAADVLSRRSFNIPASAIIRNADNARSAYRAAAGKTHPDAGGSTDEFQLVQEARRVLVSHHGQDL